MNIYISLYLYGVNSLDNQLRTRKTECHSGLEKKKKTEVSFRDVFSTRLYWARQDRRVSNRELLE